MIGIICVNSLRYSQYIYKYTLALEYLGINYYVIFWNRESDCSNELLNEHFIPYKEECDNFASRFSKVRPYLRFRSFVKGELSKRKIDKLIVLTSQTAVLFAPELLSGKIQYIFDYRDITFEKNIAYKRLVKFLANKSEFFAVSSPYFADLIGVKTDKVIFAHNTRRKLVSHDTQKEYHFPIRIVYWGMIRQVDFNKRVIDIFGNDDRFQLTYHGGGCSDNLIRYCQSKQYRNIYFTGPYTLSDIEGFACGTDILLNAYENDEIQAHAFTTKYYDAIRYGIPMIVTQESDMCSSVTKYGLGFCVDWLSDDVANLIFESYQKFSFEEFEHGRLMVIEKVQQDDDRFVKKLKEFAETRNLD